MIDKIYILNIKTEKKRRELCRKYLIEAGVPKNKISIFEASTAEGYTKSRDLCEVAANDGFDFFQAVLNKNLHNQAYIGYLAQAWSYFRFFQHICQTQETAIIMHDDIRLNCRFEDMCTAVEQLPKDFLFAQLHMVYNGLTQEDLSKWIPGTIWKKDITRADEFAYLCSSTGAAVVIERAINALDKTGIPLGWFGNFLYNGIFERDSTDTEGTYTLLAAPNPINLEIFRKRKKLSMSKQMTELLPATMGLDEIPVSSLHIDNDLSKVEIPIEKTRDN